MSDAWIAAYVLTNIAMIALTYDFFKRLGTDKPVTHHMVGMGVTCALLLGLAIK